MQILSEQIKQCRDGVVHNPYQGNDKKVVFVCSMGILRSATAARIYANKYNTRCAGTWEEALIPLTQLLVDWADELVFVNRTNYETAVMKFDMNNARIVVLHIPDDYPHMDHMLVKAFSDQYEQI